MKSKDGFVQPTRPAVSHSRVASELTDIIRERPREMADFLRAAKGLTANDMARLARQAQKAREK